MNSATSGVERIKEGMIVEVTDGNRAVDEMVVKSIGRGGHPETDRVDLLDPKEPGRTNTFVFITDLPLVRNARPGWRFLFPDPMTGAESYSQRGPVYGIRPKR